MAIDNSNEGARTGLDDGAYSRRRSNWYIWVALALLIAVALYALVSGLGYASG